jgi:sialate O-acetylesterase
MAVAIDIIILSFSDIGSGLVTKDGSRPKHFAIAGADHRFLRADAKIENDTVVVWSNQISGPIHVRYAWADNPEDINLYNREGLPASPFTTEQNVGDSE